MAADVAIQRAAAEADTDSPSWVQRLIRGIDTLPGPPALGFLAAIVVSVAITNSQDWLVGRRPVGDLDPSRSYYGVLLPATLWLIAILDGVATSALEAFRPALDASPEEIASLRRRLTTIPVRPAWLILGVSALLTLQGWVTQPELEGIVGTPLWILAFRAPFETVSVALILILVYHTIRQLRLVAALHRRASRIDLLAPVSVYAFSRLTAGTAIGFSLLLVPSVFVLPAGLSEVDVITAVAWIVCIIGISLTAFVLPLVGMHGQIVAEKQRLQSEVARRLHTTVEVLHDSVDTHDFAQSDQLHNTLAGLIAERDLVRHLPTWPWATGTLGAVISAVLLPIGLWFVTRLLERVV